MSSASGGFPIQIIINSTYTVGRDTYAIKQRKLSGADAFAKAEVIDCVIEEVEAAWPKLVYSDQIREVVRNVVRELCKTKE